MTALSLGTCPNLVELKLLGPALQTLDLKCVHLALVGRQADPFMQAPSDDTLK